MKDSFENLLEALRVTMGQSWIDPAIARIVLQQAQQSAETAEAAADTKTVAINAADAEYDQ